MSSLDLLTSTSDALTDVRCELSRARAKFPGTPDLLPALMEEVGELAQIMMHQKHEPEKGATNYGVYEEAIQVACVAIRLATEGTDGFPYKP